MKMGKNWMEKKAFWLPARSLTELVLQEALSLMLFVSLSQLVLSNLVLQV